MFVAFTPLGRSTASYYNRGYLSSFQFGGGCPVWVVCRGMGLPGLLPAAATAIRLYLSVGMGFGPFACVLCMWRRSARQRGFIKAAGCYPEAKCGGGELARGEEAYLRSA